MTVPARGSQTASGRWVRPTEKKTGADLASGVRTASFTSPVFNIEDAFELDAQLSVTAISGTGASVVIALQVSQDGLTWLTRPETVPPLTAIGVVNVTYPTPGVQARWAVTIAGTTPSITMAVDHQAVLPA